MWVIKWAICRVKGYNVTKIQIGEIIDWYIQKKQGKYSLAKNKPISVICQ